MSEEIKKFICVLIAEVEGTAHGTAVGNFDGLNLERYPVLVTEVWEEGLAGSLMGGESRFVSPVHRQPVEEPTVAQMRVVENGIKWARLLKLNKEEYSKVKELLYPVLQGLEWTMDTSGVTCTPRSDCMHAVDAAFRLLGVTEGLALKKGLQLIKTGHRLMLASADRPARKVEEVQAFIKETGGTLDGGALVASLEEGQRQFEAELARVKQKLGVE